ncbi:hypothetical protein JB92DRAFT_3107164 [Gautieria morchelliformis]|nr:hypothetical protein JB92DRAFT_3107164 [Gautieria morchelliformis]
MSSLLDEFLEGLFQHTPRCRDFITKTDGLDRLGRIVTLPCIPYNYASSPGSDALVQVLRAMTDVAPTQTISKVLGQVRASLDETREFWGTMDSKSKLLCYVDISTDEQLLEGNLKFRKLIALHTRVTLMADIFSSSTYTHGRASLSLLSGLTGTDASDILPDIGALHRACIWENIVLKSALSARGVNVSRSNPGVPSDGISLAGQATDLSNEVEVGSALPESEQSLDEGKSKEGVKKDGPWERTAKALKHIATQIPTSLTPFFQAVVKLPSLHRRSPDAGQKRQAITIGSHVAKVALCHLEWEGSDDILASYAYWTVMMGLITVLLFEERSNIHMMLIVAFRRVGGLDTLLAICRRYAAAVDRIVQIKTADGSEDDKQQPVHVFGGLKVALHLLHSLVSSKPLFESLQTLLLVTRDMKDTDPEYFEPQDFLVKLRSAVLPFVRELWESPWLVQAPLSVCKSVVLTMLELMAGENEEPKGESAPDVLPTSVGGSNVLHRHVGPDENGIQQLCDMGFPRAAAERALVQMRNNVTAAAEYLLAQPLPFPPDVDPDDANSKDVALDPPASNEPLGVEAEPVVSICDTPTDTEMTAVVDTNVASTRVEPEDTAPEEDVGRGALRLLDEHPSLIFDVKNAFIGPLDGYSSRTLPLIIQDIKDFSPGAYEIHEQPLAVHCRLLALVLNEVGSLETRLPANASKELMDVFLALLLAHPFNADNETSVVPKWLAPHLLVPEALLVMGDEPHTITIPQEDEEISQQAITDEPSYPAARQNIFHHECREGHGSRVTRRSLAYVTTQTRFALSSEETNKKIGQDPDFEEEVQELLHWWNSRLFPNKEELRDKEDMMDSIALLKAQKAVKRVALQSAMNHLTTL